MFTIIVVSYNPGDKLLETIDSIKSQTFKDYRIIVKDGLSTDGSITDLKSKYQVNAINNTCNGEIALIEGKDAGIYDAMNIATKALEEVGNGKSYVFFLNCGDVFKDESVLANLNSFIEEDKKQHDSDKPCIYYGDIFEKITQAKVSSNPRIDDYACYRNVPSHQACFYQESMLIRNPFNLKYKVRADYEQFLRCFYKEKARAVYAPLIISIYEGGGFSDQNKKISEEERKEIINLYLPKSLVKKYDFYRVITLSGLRGAIASNKVTAGAYNKLKTAIYGLRDKKEK